MEILNILCRKSSFTHNLFTTEQSICILDSDWSDFLFGFCFERVLDSDWSRAGNVKRFCVELQTSAKKLEYFKIACIDQDLKNTGTKYNYSR